MSSKKRTSRNGILLFLLFITIILGVGYFYYYQKYGRFSEKTDNAYVKQNILYLSPKVSGNIDKVNVRVPQKVSRGEIIAHINDIDYRLRFDNAKEALVQSVRAIKRLTQEAKEAKINIALGKILLDKAKKDFDREGVLYREKSISDNTYENYKFVYDKAQKSFEVSKQRYQSLLTALGNGKISQNPQVKNAIIVLEQAYLALKRCDVLSPIDGVVAKKSFTIGSMVSPKSVLLALVPQSGYWVDSNFKETQLKDIRVGQNVKLYSDLYGKDVIYHGKIEGVSAGTGSVFSMLPPQNATGNWIKIVQRIPVRISLKKEELEKYPLHIGSSMTAIVDTHSIKGKKLSVIRKNMKEGNYKEAKYLKFADLIARKIIEENI